MGSTADTFSLACTVYELFTGAHLARGKSNHDQLRKYMEIKGSMPADFIKSGIFWQKHFDEHVVFKPDLVADIRHSSAEDVANPLKLKIQQLRAQMEVFPKPNHQLKDLILDRVGPERCKCSNLEDQQYVQRGTQFAELLEGMLALTPQSRSTPKELLCHEFFTTNKK